MAMTVLMFLSLIGSGFGSMFGCIDSPKCCTTWEDCDKGMYCDGSKRGCSLAAVPLACKGTRKMWTNLLGTCGAKKKDGERIGPDWTTLRFPHKIGCVSGQGACAYCSSTCDTDKGCNVVPHGELCTQNSDCKEDLYCDPASKNHPKMLFGCHGVCQRVCKAFNQRDTQDLSQASETLEYARHLYGHSDTDIEKKLKGFIKHTAETTTPMFEQRGKPVGFTAYKGSTIVVAFKGANFNSGDAATFIDMKHVEFIVYAGDSPVKYEAHEGFVTYYNAIRKSVKAEITNMVEGMQRAEDPCTEIMITGHSLGGGMANLGALDLALAFPKIKISLWTFGAPRVFRGSTKNYQQTDNDLNSARHAYDLLTHGDNSHHRYLANLDPVPGLVLENLGYMHAGDGLVLYEAEGDSNKKHEHCDIDEAKFFASIHFTHHYTAHYAKLLKKSHGEL